MERTPARKAAGVDCRGAFGGFRENGGGVASAQRLLKAVAMVPEEVLEIVRGLGALRSLVSHAHLPDDCRAAIALRVGCLRRARRLSEMADPVADGLGEERRAQAERGRSTDPKEQILLAVATKVALDLGENCGFVLDQARNVGLSDSEIAEAMALAALCAWPAGGGAWRSSVI